MLINAVLGEDLAGRDEMVSLHLVRVLDVHIQMWGARSPDPVRHSQDTTDQWFPKQWLRCTWLHAHTITPYDAP